MNSCTRTAYKRLNVQILVWMTSSSDPPALLDDGIDASGGEVSFVTLQGERQGLDTRGERKRTRFLMRLYTLLSWYLSPVRALSLSSGELEGS